MQNENAGCLKIAKHFRMREQSVSSRAPVLLCAHIPRTTALPGIGAHLDTTGGGRVGGWILPREH